MTEPQPINDVWGYLEQPNRYAPEAQSLYEWGLNCNNDSNPFLVYLDLIGWSKECHGEHMVLGSLDSLGYMELDYLADALREYANNPHNVWEWVNNLMAYV